VGLLLLAFSGTAMFAMQPATYLHSSGFLAKMVVVAALAVNGVFLGRRLPTMHVDSATLMMGAVSIVSWYASLAIAMYKKQVSLSVPEYLGIYAAAVVLAWLSYRQVMGRLQAAPERWTLADPPVASTFAPARHDPATFPDEPAGSIQTGARRDGAETDQGVWPPACPRSGDSEGRPDERMRRERPPRGDARPHSALSSEERAELIRLRRQIRSLRTEKEYLEGVAVFFARQNGH